MTTQESHGATSLNATTQDPSVGELLGKVAADLSTLMRQEMALAKAELREEAKTAGKGAGELTGAALAGYFLLLFLSVALMAALDAIMPLGWAAATVGLLWGIAAAVLALKGKKDISQVKAPEKTIETLKEDVQWAKHPTS